MKTKKLTEDKKVHNGMQKSRRVTRSTNFNSSKDIRNSHKVTKSLTEKIVKYNDKIEIINKGSNTSKATRSPKNKLKENYKKENKSKGSNTSKVTKSPAKKKIVDNEKEKSISNEGSSTSKVTRSPIKKKRKENNEKEKRNEGSNTSKVTKSPTKKKIVDNNEKEKRKEGSNTSKVTRSQMKKKRKENYEKEKRNEGSNSSKVKRSPIQKQIKYINKKGKTVEGANISKVRKIKEKKKKNIEKSTNSNPPHFDDHIKIKEEPLHKTTAPPMVIFHSTTLEIFERDSTNQYLRDDSIIDNVSIEKDQYRFKSYMHEVILYISEKMSDLTLYEVEQPLINIKVEFPDQTENSVIIDTDLPDQTEQSFLIDTEYPDHRQKSVIISTEIRDQTENSVFKNKEFPDLTENSVTKYKEFLDLTENSVILDIRLPDQTDEPVNINTDSLDQTENSVIISTEFRDETENSVFMDTEFPDQTENSINIDTEFPDQTENSVIIRTKFRDQTENSVIIDTEFPDQTKNSVILNTKSPDQAEKLVVIDTELSIAHKQNEYENSEQCMKQIDHITIIKLRNLSKKVISKSKEIMICKKNIAQKQKLNYSLNVTSVQDDFLCVPNEESKHIRNQEIIAVVLSENDSIIETSLNDVSGICKSNEVQIKDKESNKNCNEYPKECSLLNNYDTNGVFLPSSEAFPDISLLELINKRCEFKEKDVKMKTPGVADSLLGKLGLIQNNQQSGKKKWKKINKIEKNYMNLSSSDIDYKSTKNMRSTFDIDYSVRLSDNEFETNHEEIVDHFVDFGNMERIQSEDNNSLKSCKDYLPLLRNKLYGNNLNLSKSDIVYKSTKYMKSKSVKDDSDRLLDHEFENNDEETVQNSDNFMDMRLIENEDNDSLKSCKDNLPLVLNKVDQQDMNQSSLDNNDRSTKNKQNISALDNSVGTPNNEFKTNYEETVQNSINFRDIKMIQNEDNKSPEKYEETTVDCISNKLINIHKNKPCSKNDSTNDDSFKFSLTENADISKNSSTTELSESTTIFNNSKIKEIHQNCQLDDTEFINKNKLTEENLLYESTKDKSKEENRVKKVSASKRIDLLLEKYSTYFRSNKNTIPDSDDSIENFKVINTPSKRKWIEMGHETNTDYLEIFSSKDLSDSSSYVPDICKNNENYATKNYKDPDNTYSPIPIENSTDYAFEHFEISEDTRDLNFGFNSEKSPSSFVSNENLANFTSDISLSDLPESSDKLQLIRRVRSKESPFTYLENLLCKIYFSIYLDTLH